MLTLPVLYTVSPVPAGVREGRGGLEQERSAAIGQGAVHHVAGYCVGEGGKCSLLDSSVRYMYLVCILVTSAICLFLFSGVR